MPTYRRIEKDLRSIFPELEADVRRYMLRDREGESGDFFGERQRYKELVVFGMEDVAKYIQDTLKSLNETVGAAFNNLAGNYLRDVVRGEGATYDQGSIGALKEDRIDEILDWVEEHVLNESDKQLLRYAINRIKNQDDLVESDRYAAHFFSRLHDVVTYLDEAEISIRKFISVCNKYLFRKKFEYARNKTTLIIRGSDGGTIELAQLSSGEKQIVSIFAYMYFGKVDQYMLFIDEPELSLSVDWQSSLLPDIWDSDRCAFLAAVTHSPFIFENEFERYTCDLLGCRS